MSSRMIGYTGHIPDQEPGDELVEPVPQVQAVAVVCDFEVQLDLIPSLDSGSFSPPLFHPIVDGKPREETDGHVG